MSEQLPGLELFLSSEKAVEGANKFRAAVESAAQAVERIGEVVDKLDAALDRMGVGAKSAGESTKKVGEAAGKAGEGLKQAGAGAQDFESKIGRLGVTAGSVGRQLTFLLGAAGAVSGLGAAASVFSDYEDKLKILGSIANATGSDLRKLEQAASDLSRNSRFTPREALQGLTELSRAGLSAEDAIKALKPTADLARVGLLGLGDSSAIVTKTLTQFALGAEQSARVADVLAKAANASNADVGTLADSLAKTGPDARQFGVSLEDTVAALAKLADNGLAANIAGTGLQRVLIQLRSPTEEAQRALLGLGLTAEQINPEKVGLTGALRNLSDAGLSVQDSVSLVGTEFASLLTILTGSVGAIDQVGAALRDSTGEAAKQAAAGADTLAAAFADLRNASEEFAVSTARGGISGALTAITKTGAEAIRVLSGDSKAMQEASVQGQALAVAIQLAATAMGTLISFRASSFLLSFASASKVASTALSAIGFIAKANPFALIATAIGAAGSALIAFGTASASFLEDQRKQRENAEYINDLYERQAKLLAEVAGRGSQFATVKGPQDQFADAFAELQKLGLALEKLRGQKIDASLLLDTKALVGSSTAIEGLREAVLSIGAAFDDATRSSAATVEALKRYGSIPGAGLRGIFFPDDVRQERGAQEFGKRIEQLRAFLRPFGIELDENRRAFLDYEKALQIVGQGFADLEKRAGNAGVALARTGASSKKDEISSAVRSLIVERERELDLAQKIGVEREKAILLAEGEKRAARGLYPTEDEALAKLAQQLVDGEKLVEQRRRERQEAEKAAQLQRDLPKNLAELQKRYDEELAIAQAVGVERELLRAAAEAENDAKAIGLALDSEAFAQLKAQAEQRARIAFEERQQKREARVDRRQDEALRRLEQEEQLLKLGGAEREKYRLQIEAENEARQAGLVLGSAEFADYVKRKSAVGELARAQEQLAQLGSQFASSWTSALEQFIIDGGKARDVAKALYQDLARLAFRQTAGAGLNSLFMSAGRSLAGALSSSPTAPTTGIDEGAGFDPQPLMLGGVIPAMDGQVVDQFGYLSRGDRTYSFAEGGKTTPEAIFPLERDARGRLGIAAAGGGGGDTFNMSFPAVRSAQDARALRATVSQQFRAAKAADRSGRRGRRPAGE